MKATKIYYQKCFNLGNYQNEVVGIELEIGEGEKAADVLEKAKQFVESKDMVSANIQEYENCLRIASDPDNYTGDKFGRLMSSLLNTRIKTIYHSKLKKYERKKIFHSVIQFWQWQSTWFWANHFCDGWMLSEQTDSNREDSIYT